MRVFGIRSRFALLCSATILVGGFSLATNPFAAQAAVVTSQVDVVGPAGSGQFGQQVTVLPNGNYVVSDPGFDLLNVGAAPAVLDAGAVYLYNGKTNALISTVTGSQSGDRIGHNGIRTLGVRLPGFEPDYLIASDVSTPADVSSALTGQASAVYGGGGGSGYTGGPNPSNFVILSSNWHNGTEANAGAATWVSGETGLNGVVTDTNSLVGSAANDSVGGYGLNVLSNGNYVVRSVQWHANKGAITWGSGATGVAGVVSASNSLVGASAGDSVANYDPQELPNGNFVLQMPYWNGHRGAVAWGSGTAGVIGEVSALNSLVGSTPGDNVGDYGLDVLPNGNYVVRSSGWDLSSTVQDAGAVTLGNGTSGVKGEVSSANSLVGSQQSDNVGSNGIRQLGSPRDAYGNDLRSDLAAASSNFVVVSSGWDNATATNAGAVTWVDGALGLTGAVSAANSLVGTVANDNVGEDVAVLSNGNYVVNSSAWGVDDVGAATWGNGATGTTGTVSASNSLVGTTPGDSIGSYGIVVLPNCNYVVKSPYWDLSPTVSDVGAVTWGNGATAGPRTVGEVTALNSLVGSAAEDNIGSNDVVALPNGNFVVVSPYWYLADDQVGAVTFSLGDAGAAHTVGPVSTANSLVGTTDGDRVGSFGVQPLTNGNYVVKSRNWNNGTAYRAGAVTWGSGTTGRTGVVSASNSIVGSTSYDYVGNDVTPLENGNFVVAASSWDDGIVPDVGSVTWGNGTTGATVGRVSSAISLIGSSEGDYVGNDGILELANGNYVVTTLRWDNGSTAQDAGAVTWGSGTAGVAGVVSAANSLVGSAENDYVGNNRIIELTNGNYVVTSSSWDNGVAAQDAGAVTWGSGTAGVAGVVSAANSLVGSAESDDIGGYGVTPLVNGNYVVDSIDWDNGSIIDAGAVTWGDGTTGIVGAVSPANSLVGSTNDDRVGDYNFGSTGVFTDPNGSYLVVSDSWDNGAVADAGAVTYGQPNGGVVGTISATNSAIGTPPELVELPILPASPQAAPGMTGRVLSVVEGRTSANAYAVRTSQNRVLLLQVPSDFVPLTPGRITDTRPSGTTVDTLFAAGGVQGAGTTMELTVAGRSGVPADASAVSLNVTAADPTDDGFITVFPCGSPKPNSSNVNYAANANAANGVIVKMGTGGKVCLYTSAATHLIVDVNGSFPASSSLVSTNPARMLDTRPLGTTVDGVQQAGGVRTAGSTTTLPIAGRADVPTDAKAVVLSVTVDDPTDAGFLTVYPCGTPIPVTSNLNYEAGATVANLVIAKVGTGGAVCIFSQSATHLIVDLGGYFPAGSSYVPLDPARVLETRTGASTIDGVSNGVGIRPAGRVTAFTIAGRGGVPASAATVTLNVTSVDSSAEGFVTVYPCDVDRPQTSNLNFTAGVTVANAVISKLDAGGKVCLYNSDPTHLIVDVNGYLAS
jgi:trimeric autotransporter adhesin